MIFFNPLEQFNIFVIKTCFTSNFVNAVMLHTILFFFFLRFLSIFSTNILVFIWTKLFKLLKISYIKNTKLKISIFSPIFVYIFFIILINNMLSLMPFSYAITSSIVFNFYIVLTMFLFINGVGILYHKWNFFNLFMPKGLTLTFSWFLIFFETVSYFARIFSLTIRLFANILSGHILQHILIFFVYKLFLFPKFYFFIFLFPWAVAFLVTYLEFVIAFLQAYVLIILLLIYFGNTINLH